MQTFNEYRKGKGESKRSEVLTYWRSLESTPISLQPKPYGHYGTSIDEDTVRITGSKAFVSAIMARLKDLLVYETSDVKLDVKFAPTQYRHAGGYEPNYEFNFSAIYKSPGQKLAIGPKKIISQGT